ncbi:hypothetical protein D3874_03185 [Oleomonas cavernae]|uniref:Uncharacterized protein n=1 Tax=Oleomonas cavernae TaxID=2320859 RepID=A0A418WU93_9PROT|nr:hypothetical protein D3874_03185 [Oleomonas cavernae]
MIQLRSAFVAQGIPAGMLVLQLADLVGYLSARAAGPEPGDPASLLAAVQYELQAGFDRGLRKRAASA